MSRLAKDVNINVQCVDLTLPLVCREALSKTRRMMVVEPKDIVKEVMFSFRNAPTTNHRLRRRFHVWLDHLRVFNAKKLLEALELYSQSIPNKRVSRCARVRLLNLVEYARVCCFKAS
jgi:hypothetical protein